MRKRIERTKEIEEKVIYSNKKINKDLTYRLTRYKEEFYYNFYFGNHHLINPPYGMVGVFKKMFSEKSYKN